MRKTNVTFVNRGNSTKEKIINFINQHFGIKAIIKIEENRIIEVNFGSFSIIDNSTQSRIKGLPSELTLHNLSLINHLVQIIEQHNSYYDELADFYVQ